MQIVFSCAVTGIFLWFASTQIDWLGLRAQAMLRVGLLALVVIGAVLLYAGALFLSGVRLRHFTQHERMQP